MVSEFRLLIAITLLLLLPAVTAAEQNEDEAIAAARAAVNAKPDDPDLHMNLAQALIGKARRVGRVVDATLDSKAIAPGQQTIRLPLGVKNSKIEVIYDPDLFEDALREVREAIRLAPMRKDLRFSESYLLTDAGDIERASAAIRRAIESLEGEPGLASTLASYGSERVKRGDVQGGAILLGVVATAFPGNASVQVEHASALARDGKGEEARTALDRTGEAASVDLDVHRKRALIALLLQDFSRAGDAFRKAYALSRQDPDRLGAAAATFGLDPSTAQFALEELAAPASSADPGAVEIAKAFMRAVPAPREQRYDLAKFLMTKRQHLLAIPVLHRVLLEQPGHSQASGMLDGIYRVMDYPRPRGPSASKAK